MKVVRVKEINRKIPPPPWDPIINRFGFSFGLFLLSGLLIYTKTYNGAIGAIFGSIIMAWLGIIAFRSRQEKVDKVFTEGMWGLSATLTNGETPVFLSPDQSFVETLQDSVLAVVSGQGEDHEWHDVSMQCFSSDELKMVKH